MTEKSKGVFVKVFLYLFDYISDLVNGYLLSTKEATGNTTTFHITVLGHCPVLWKNESILSLDTHNKMLSYEGNQCLGDNQVHTNWGHLTIGFSYLPALLGVVFMSVAACQGKNRCRDFFLLPIRTLLWPLLVPIHT